MQGSYVEFSFIEKLHARITEVSPANPGETLNDAVERLIAELEAAEADARECRAERARYGDAMTERLADAEAERDALRVRCIEWLPFSEAAETIDSILVWREDAGVFVAFYADEQECWFTSFGEDLTGDLPTFYAKMPKGPTSE